MQQSLWRRIRDRLRGAPKPTAPITPSGPSITHEQQLIHAVHGRRVFPSPTQLLRLPRILKQRERAIFLISVACFLASVLLLARAGVVTFRSSVPEVGGSYTETVVGQPQLVNPLWSDANDVDRDLVALTFAGLMHRATNNTLEPSLASGFSVSADGKVYTATLKPNLHWHDGESVTAADVVFTINAIQNPAYRSTHLNDFKNITVAAPDEHTVVFTLTQPFSPFPQLLTLGILPEHIWSEIPPEQARLAEFNLKPIGAGPYQFKSIEKTKEGAIHTYVLSRVNTAPHVAPYLQTISFRFQADAASAADALDRGNVDGLAFLSRELRARLTHPENLTYYPLPLPQITAVFMNQKSNPFLRDTSIRQALANAIDRTNIVHTAFQDDAIVIDGPLLPSSLGYTNDVTHYPFDLTHADDLLTKDGFVRADANSPRAYVLQSRRDVRYSKGAQISISLTTVNVPEYVATANLIKTAWESLGISVNLITVDPKNVNRQILATRTFDALLYSELLGADPDPYPFWHSSQADAPGANISGYTSKRTDALLEEGRSLSDPSERTKRYVEFQKLITTDLPAIFLVTPTYSYALNHRVQGVSIGAIITPADRFDGINNWYVKTRGVWK